jgi:hypothetical protein
MSGAAASREAEPLRKFACDSAPRISFSLGNPYAGLPSATASAASCAQRTRAAGRGSPAMCTAAVTNASIAAASHRARARAPPIGRGELPRQHAQQGRSAQSRRLRPAASVRHRLPTQSARRSCAPIREILSGIPCRPRRAARHSRRPRHQ